MVYPSSEIDASWLADGNFLVPITDRGANSID
jgi:hypothetical protein